MWIEERLSVGLYCITIFVGAFLLFQVQPLIGKYVLPWFGGSAGVWASALLFFQLFLLLGYAYAHAIATWLQPRAQALAHLALLSLALISLPVIPPHDLKPDGSGDPVWGIVLLLTVSIGLPYLVLAANGPLLQHWFAREHQQRRPYRLYALSNAASLLALLSYPLWFERLLTLTAQAWLWSASYVVFTSLCAMLAVTQLRARKVAPVRQRDRTADLGLPVPADTRRESAADTAGQRLAISRIPLWVALPAVASAMLLATTNHITQNVAPIPMLWVLPLSIYLLSFILTFDSERWYRPHLNAMILLVLLGAATYSELRGVGWLPLIPQVSLLLAVLFFVAMSCHGQLVTFRPGRRHLTLFYLMVSAGGAIGGAIVALGAPLVFEDYWEFHASLVAAGLVTVLGIGRGRTAFSSVMRRRANLVFGGAAAALVVGMANLFVAQASVAHDGQVSASRGFYGAIKVYEVDSESKDSAKLVFVHGQTVHGVQFLSEERRNWKTTYYSPESGIGLALANHPARAERSIRIGLIGLGTGTLASYAGAGDRAVFYEINGQVLDVARSRFTYLKDAETRGATLEIRLGDARIVLERELEAAQLERFDVLAVDAFNSDAIPIHLLTREAIHLYESHLEPGGIIAIHVSNKYIDLHPVVRALAADAELEARLVVTADDEARDIRASEWIILTNNREFLEALSSSSASVPWPDHARKPLLWTDDYSALLPLLKR